MTLVAGVGGLGKSTWLAGIAARLSRGELAGGIEAATIIVSFEDAAEEVLVPRIEVAGGDIERIYDLVLPEASLVANPVSLPGDLENIAACARDSEAKLVVIDPIVAAIDVAFDAHKDQHVRAVLAGLVDMAERQELAVAMVGHLNKAPSREAYLRVANSAAFWNAARSVVLVTEDPEEPENHRLIAQQKANYSRRAPIERHRIEEVVLPDKLDPDTGRPIATSRMVFVEHADDVNGDDLLAPRGRSDGKAGEAAALLLDALEDGEWHDSAGLKALAADAGISESTVKRVAARMPVEEERTKEFPSRTMWRLPQLGQALSPRIGPTGETLDSCGFEAPAMPSRAKALGKGPTGPTAELSELEKAELRDRIAREKLARQDAEARRHDALLGDADRIPRLGDAEFLNVLAAAIRADQITEAEARERIELHKRVAACRA